MTRIKQTVTFPVKCTLKLQTQNYNIRFLSVPEQEHLGVTVKCLFILQFVRIRILE